MNSPIVVLDACVLIPMPLCDTLLRAAEKGLYRFYTSPKILEETTKNLAKIFIKQKKFDSNIAKQNAEKRVNQIKKAFPEALVEPNESLVESLENDPKDRHVLAAAIEAQKLENNNTVIIVTHNLKDFPNFILAKHNVQAMSADNFFLSLIEFYDTTEDLFDILQEQAKGSKQKLFNLLKRLEEGNAKEFVKVILTEYFLQEILNDVCQILTKYGRNQEESKYLKGEKYYIMSLKEQNLIINSVSKKCLIESNCSLLIKNNVSLEDIKILNDFIQQSKVITQLNFSL